MDEAASQPAWFQRVVEKESCFPPDVQRRLRALRKIQLRMVILDGEFYREVYNVLAKCHNLYDEFYQRRADIISGAYEPTERDCEWDDEFPDNMKADYSLPSDVAEADSPRHTEDSEDASRKTGENAGNETVKVEDQGKEEASRSNDEPCKIGKEKEVDKSTELSESGKGKMTEERSNDGTSKTEERKEQEEVAGLTESTKEQIVKETRTNEEVSKVVEESKEANRPAGLARGGKEEIKEDKGTTDEVPKVDEVKETKEAGGLVEGGKVEMARSSGLAEDRKEDKRTSDEEPKIEEIKEPKETGGLAQVAKEEMEKSTGLAEGRKEDKRTSDEEPKTEEVKEAKETVGLVQGAKEEMEKSTGLAESGKEDKRTSDEVPKIEEVKGAKQPGGLSEGAKEEMDKSTGLSEGRKEGITEDKITSDELPKIEEGKEAKGTVELAEGGKEETVKTTGLAVIGKAVITEDKRTSDEAPKIEVKEAMGAEGGKEDNKTRESQKSKHKKSDKDEEGAKAEALETRKSKELRGIPDFWLTIFMNVEILRDLVEERDKPVLSHLIDIRTVYHDEDKPMGFTLEFHFSPNDFFTNTVLTKDYDLILRWHNHDPFMFHGPKMTGCRGCTINWKDGQDVTVMEVIKKQTHKRRGTKRTVTRLIKVKSFFDFFSPPLIPDDPDDLDEESLQILRKDCQVAHYLWDGVNPSPLLFYTGEIWDHDDMDAYYFTEVEGGGDEEV